MVKLGRILLTLTLVAVAIYCGHWVWSHYLYSPWTRDGRIRADVVTIAPDVSGRVTHLYVHDNQYVTKGQVLFEIDDVRYQAEVDERQAEIEYAQQAWQLAQAQYERRAALRGSNALSVESIDNSRQESLLKETEYNLARKKLETARINLARTQVIAPEDGAIANLNLQEGNYAVAGEPALSLIEAGSFYATGYFEETKILLIHPGQKADLTLMNGSIRLSGNVRHIGKGIANTNTHADSQLLPQVQQTFNWVRLPQRIPVDIALNDIPPGIHLSAGMTVSIQLEELGKGNP